MTTQTQVQGLGLFASWGFTLEHTDDHIVELHHQGELIAPFSQEGATETSIQKECAKHLITIHMEQERGGRAIPVPGMRVFDRRGLLSELNFVRQLLEILCVYLEHPDKDAL